MTFLICTLNILNYIYFKNNKFVVGKSNANNNYVIY